MRIICKNCTRSHFGGFNLFVFEFQNQAEADSFVGSLRYCAGHLPELRTQEMLLDTADKLEHRCDGRYAHDDAALSASLFPDEMARFMMTMVGIMWVYEDFAKMLDDVFAGLDAAVPDIEEDPFN